MAAEIGNFRCFMPPFPYHMALLGSLVTEVKNKIHPRGQVMGVGKGGEWAVEHLMDSEKKIL